MAVARGTDGVGSTRCGHTPSGSIVNGSGERASQLRRSGNVDFRAPRKTRVTPLLRPEEVGLVLDGMKKLGDKERTTDGEAPVIVALDWGLVGRIRTPLIQGLPVLKGIRVVVIVAIELIRAAVELVTSGLGCDHDLATAAAPEGCVVVAALQGELLDGVDAWRVQQSPIGAAIVDVGAVHRPVVGAHARTVDRNRGIARQSKSWFIAQLIGDAGLQ